MHTLSLERTAQSAVVSNTYRLLAMTLAWSAGMAYLGMNLSMGVGMFLALSIAGLVALFATMALRNSVWGLAMVFVFTGLEGLTLGPVLNAYLNMPNGSGIVMTATGATAGIFTLLSLYATASKRDFSFLGGFLFVGLIVMLIASLVMIFFPVPAVQVILAAFGVLIFSGYILYDTANLVRGGETNYILATISLYLDILNLFLSLLRLIAWFRNRDD